MAILHAKPCEVIDVGPRGVALKTEKTKTLVKTARLEVIRLAVPAGKQIQEHQVKGEVTVHCLEGHVAFTAGGEAQDLKTGQMLYMEGNQPHSLRGVEDSSVLVTILL